MALLIPNADLPSEDEEDEDFDPSTADQEVWHAGSIAIQ